MTTANFLPREDFARVVQCAPLVSVDLIITDAGNNFLVGLRENEPAKGTYFVPGGVIRKGETLDQAFERILQAETGLTVKRTDARFLGVYEHFYQTNRFLDPSYGTHYVVLAYAIGFATRPEVRQDSQHSVFRWMSRADITTSTDVHENTKAYMR
jgi:colanic acid biosynthesis protein WcaH